MKILIVEDEPSLQELTKEFLLKERHVVESATTLAEAQSRIAIYEYDAILLDIMLPDGNGLTLLEQLRKEGKQESVIILSAKDSIDDKVLGLELGADDYLPKPFHYAELNARLRSIFRRKYQQGESTIQFGNLAIYPNSFEIRIEQRNLELNRKEYDILYYFVNRPERLISKELLAEGVWGDHIDQVDNYDFIYAQIKNLRKKLKEAGANFEIKSVYGFGYRLTLNG